MASKSRFYSLLPHLLYSIFLIIIFIWCSLIIAAPWLASKEHVLSSGLMYFFFSRICHQIPERSFFIFGKQLAVCSRCAGLYSGFLFGAILYPILFKLNRIWMPPRKLIILAAIPIAIDMFIRIFCIAENTFTSRLTTGFILGTTMALFVAPGILSLAIKPQGNKLAV